jgi:hypothetical protein
VGSAAGVGAGVGGAAAVLVSSAGGCIVALSVSASSAGVERRGLGLSPSELVGLLRAQDV